MSERLAYQSKMEAMLTEWPERMALMEGRAPAIPAAKREVYSGWLKQMREKFEETQRKLAEYRAAADAAWPEARKNLERAWSDLANAYEKALTQFDGVKN
jgi:hypothetical protein